MNIDELKMILETINATTGLAKDNESDTRFMRQCRDRLGIGSSGYMLPE